jgi:hypothetical protein
VNRPPYIYNTVRDARDVEACDRQGYSYSHDYTEVTKDDYRFLRRCGVSGVKGLSVSGDSKVLLAPRWAVRVMAQCNHSFGHRRGRSTIARALRRATRDTDFRDALDAAVQVGLAPQLVAAQMGRTPS